MIGVIANPSDHPVVREFFELFKTPWEFYRSGQRYDVLLCDGSAEVHDQFAPVVLIYAGHRLRSDAASSADSCSEQSGGRSFLFEGRQIPIYGNIVTFQGKQPVLLRDAESQEAAAYLERPRERVLVRIGYDLFKEIRALLSVGQPASNAATPTLDLHIAFLRDVIAVNGALVEIPPVPEGYQFIACLTHDLDHPLIRQHRFDHTMFGFLYRAVFRSAFNLLTGRGSWGQLLANWGAALKLPFVYLGLAKDFWQGFDRYPKLDGGPHSSFFAIPFRDYPGRSDRGPAPKQRAARYSATDIATQIHTLRSAGCEIGLHGIDAWRDSAKGREELEEIRRITGQPNIGVRMHWLYFDQQSPVTLERAGADYDSTVGYNETIGYRAGTTQVYKPLEATRLLELPLHIMDTALFSPTRLALPPGEASKRVAAIIDSAVQYGGTVTVNWHDRSIAPERCWDDFYVDLVGELRSKGAWFATAAQAVSWFRKRRAATFEKVGSETAEVLVRNDVDEDVPELQLRVHGCHKSRQRATVGPGSSPYAPCSVASSPSSACVVGNEQDKI